MRKGSLSVLIPLAWIFSLSLVEARADSWYKTYGNEFKNYSRSIRQTSDGGYILSGWTYSSANIYEPWAAKLNGNGEIQWQKKFGNSQYGGILSMEQTSDQGFIGAGWSYPLGVETGKRQPWVLRLDANGNVKWQKAYSTDFGEGRSIRPTPDGGSIVAGWTSSNGAGSTDLWVFKLDQNGNIQWQKTYGTSEGEESRSIQTTTDGGYVLAGFTNQSGNYDAWVLKLNAGGDAQWQKTFGGDKGDFAQYVQQTQDGGYIAAGGTESFGFGEGKGWVFKLDASGNVQWQKAYGGKGYHWLYAIAQTQEGGYVCAGETYSSCLGNQAIWVLKLDSAGETEWQRGIGGIKDDECMAYSVLQAADGAYVAAGYTSAFGAGEMDAAVIKLDQDGNIADCIQDALSRGAAFLTTAAGTDAQISGQNSGASVVNTSVPAGNLDFTAMSNNHTPYNVCSVSSPPLIFWESTEAVKSYEIEFSSREDFSSPVKIKTNASRITMKASDWKKVIKLPGTNGGWVYWRVTGIKKDKTRISVLSCTLFIEPPRGVEEADLDPTEKDSLPSLSWKNNCNVKFKVYFGADEGFSKKTSLSFKVKDPTDNGGAFSKELTKNQWSSIRKLVGDATGATLFWYVESWDGLNQYFKTEVKSFVLAD